MSDETNNLANTVEKLMGNLPTREDYEDLNREIQNLLEVEIGRLDMDPEEENAFLKATLSDIVGGGGHIEEVLQKFQEEEAFRRGKTCVPGSEGSVSRAAYEGPGANIPALQKCLPRVFGESFVVSKDSQIDQLLTVLEGIVGNLCQVRKELVRLKDNKADPLSDVGQLQALWRDAPKLSDGSLAARSPSKWEQWRHSFDWKLDKAALSDDLRRKLDRLFRLLSSMQDEAEKRKIGKVFQEEDMPMYLFGQTFSSNTVSQLPLDRKAMDKLASSIISAPDKWDEKKVADAVRAAILLGEVFYE